MRSAPPAVLRSDADWSTHPVLPRAKRRRVAGNRTATVISEGFDESWEEKWPI